MGGFVVLMGFCFGSQRIVAMVSPVLRLQTFRIRFAKDAFESTLLASSMDHRGRTFVEVIRGVES
jgi:hypothetical protein